eukprot:gene9153-6434_t
MCYNLSCLGGTIFLTPLLLCSVILAFHHLFFISANLICSYFVDAGQQLVAFRCALLFASRGRPSEVVGFRGITIETNETPNPLCMRLFSMEASFLKPNYTLDIPSPAQAFKSPLAAEIFDAVPDVEGIFIADEYITIRKSEAAEWGAVIPAVSERISSFVESGRPLLSPEAEEQLIGYNDDTNPEDGDDEVVLAVKELLATRIRPMLMADGGKCTVFLLLEGACKTCPSSHITLKSGIERMLMHWIPEVVEAQEVSEDFALDLLQAKKQRREAEKAKQSQ